MITNTTKSASKSFSSLIDRLVVKVAVVAAMMLMMTMIMGGTTTTTTSTVMFVHAAEPTFPPQPSAILFTPVSSPSSSPPPVSAPASAPFTSSPPPASAPSSSSPPPAGGTPPSSPPPALAPSSPPVAYAPTDPPVMTYDEVFGQCFPTRRSRSRLSRLGSLATDLMMMKTKATFNLRGGNNRRQRQLVSTPPPEGDDDEVEQQSNNDNGTVPPGMNTVEPAPTDCELCCNNTPCWGTEICPMWVEQCLEQCEVWGLP